MKNLTKKLCLFAMLCITLNAQSQVPKLNSLESVAPTVFLDFDGQTVTSVWNNYTTFYCEPAGYTPAQINSIFNQVSEDFRPFALNITTDSTKYWNAPSAQRFRIIFTPTSAWYPNAGGVAYVGTFTYGDDVPGFVFTNRLNQASPNHYKYVAEACSHETGHALGLTHQSKFNETCSLLENYNSGQGSGETGWAPIMGKSYYKNMTGWNNGPIPSSCTSMQDNLSIITSQNGFTYREDDFTDIANSSSTQINEYSFNINGIVTTPLDRDAFKFINTKSSPVHIEVNPFSTGANNENANLDIAVQLFNSANQLIRTYDPETSMSVIIDTTLANGTYYIIIDGTGNINAGNYGSLGSYSITGSRGTLAIREVNLKGINNGNTHKLHWNIVSDEPIVNQILETSTNGRNFETIMNDASGVSSFNFTPKTNGNVFYRLKATSSIGESIFSNITVLKANTDDKSFTVSTIIDESIRVVATEDFQYKLFDANARLIATGTNKKGINNINVNKMTRGLYVLQIIHNNNIQTERIIKQ
jgi:hypothetical protein